MLKQNIFGISADYWWCACYQMVRASGHVVLTNLTWSCCDFYLTLVVLR